MSLEENKALVRGWLDARNAHDVERALLFFISEWHEGIRLAFNDFSTAFPDLIVTINELIAEGNKVVCWWTLKGTQLGTYEHIPATGKSVEIIGIDIYTITNGKISGFERSSDNLSVMRQLGATLTWQGAELN
jgi:steroid delta-isomerase-like uncharacterized protein